MKALITGASSGLGRDMAYELGKRGYDLILVARNKKELERTKKNINTNVKMIPLDLSIIENCYKLYEKTKDEDITVLINNAGFGLCGKFEETSLEKELNMIDLNIKAVHILTKLFYTYFKKKNKGYILNVASSAAFTPGPLMNTYYASKAYVLRITEALYEESRKEAKNVSLSILCPGPVDTNFNKVAGVKFGIKPAASEYISKYAIKKMFQKKLIIIPTFKMKLTYILEKILPVKFIMKFVYRIQKEKITRK